MPLQRVRFFFFFFCSDHGACANPRHECIILVFSVITQKGLNVKRGERMNALIRHVTWYAAKISN